MISILKPFFKTTQFVIFCICCSQLQAQSPGKQGMKLDSLRHKIQHIIVIYQENWSFDGLYGKFPGCNNLDNAGHIAQVDKQGNRIELLPNPIRQLGSLILNEDKFPKPLPAQPYDLSKYIRSSNKTGDLVHRFYTEQLQIDGGKMDKFVCWSDNGGLTLSYYDASQMPEGKLAKQYTLCDNFFHSAFGGSFLNHIWFIAAAPPIWKNAPKFMLSQPDPNLPGFDDAPVSKDGYAINTALSVNDPHPPYISDSMLVPNQDMPTIGDRLNDKNISWTWYSGGWKEAMEGDPDPTFQFHHQPFTYFRNYANGTDAKTKHLKDEKHFSKDLRKGDLPEVVFIKPLGRNNEHPGYAALETGQRHVAWLVRKIMNSRYWNECAIIITYDENGGRWDHVAPPVIDRWGPGTRVPAIIISPYAKKGFVDHTQYETVSILKFIETRYGLVPLSTRDANANDLLNAFDF
jgi:phospholipase C